MTALCMCCKRSDKVGRHAHRERCPAHPDAVVLAVTEPCRNANPTRVYGFDITYVTSDGRELGCHYVTASERTARRKTMLRSLAREVTRVRALTEKEYVKTYGRGRM
jgi:hypothetical protein